MPQSLIDEVRRRHHEDEGLKQILQGKALRNIKFNCSGPQCPCKQ